MLRLLLMALLAALVSSAAGCGSSSEGGSVQQHPTEASAPTPGPGVEGQDALPVAIIAEPRWGTAVAQSLRTLMEGYDTIVLGEVRGIVLPYDPRPGYLGWTPSPCDLPPDHPKFPVCSWTPSAEEASRPPGRGFTVYAIEVQRSLRPSGLPPGKTIFVRQAGGIWEGVVYQFEGAPLLQVGKTYLLSLDEAGTLGGLVESSGYSAGVPFAQYIVQVDGTVRPLDEVWSYLPAVQALTGITVDEAAVKIQAAIAEAPLPTPTPQP